MFSVVEYLKDGQFTILPSDVINITTDTVVLFEGTMDECLAFVDEL